MWSCAVLFKEKAMSYLDLRTRGRQSPKPLPTRIHIQFWPYAGIKGKRRDLK